jgi:anaerobic selenocysteine-containing dehydrogenase
VAGLAAAFGRGAMTNNWTDIGNATLVVVMGANPVENHPASIAHVNKARMAPGTYYDRAGNPYTTGKAAAKLVVIDPRQTRTARQADLYVRIRPGTDIAFINGLVNYLIDATNTGTGLWAGANANKKARWEAFHTVTAAKSLYNDAGTKVNVTRPKYTDATFRVTATDYVRSTHTIGADTFSNVPEVSGVNPAGNTGTPDLYGADSSFTNLKAHVAPYTPAVVADICGCTEAELIQVANLYIENSRCSSVAADTDAFGATINDPKLAGYRSTTMMYAMGLTQHTYGSQNVKSFAVLQTLLGNMGRSGGGINALRGIHNVQGSTDMGLLQHLIPGYSANPSGTFGSYMNGLYGNRLNGTSGSGANDPYVFANGGLQQKGFYSMTKCFFGDTSYRGTWTAQGETASAVGDDQASVDALFALWPKGNGDAHIRMFRKMAAGTITGAVVWGQNPAVTEPNQSMVRDGLKNLDILVVVDMFATETATCDRKGTGTTYLIPAASHVEEAGSATNSGRVLQWRYQAMPPAGNSKTDFELLMRFAYALQANGAFAHITNRWGTSAAPMNTWSNAYTILYGNQYGWAGPGNAFDCEAATKKAYKQMCAPQNNGGALWIYLEAWDTVTTSRGGGWPTIVDDNSPIRAKSRVTADADASGGGHLLYKNWGYAWLVNRRVLYTNGDTPWDQSDAFQGPDLVARLYVSTNTSVIDYSTAYRTIHRLSDKPLLPGGASPAGTAYAGRFPWHTEPYESPRPDLANVFGYNSSTNSAYYEAPGEGNCLYIGTNRGTSAQFPLVLTTIRCVEHFQGGPITRNNSYNVEQEPAPWIEINSVDARAAGIKDGDWVNVVTARSNSTSDQLGRTIYSPTGSSTDNFGKGFKARVGTGTNASQRVGPGVVAIPWHWGDQGLSTGSRANDLCIDAFDANTTIPEYKACLCRIEKA